MGDTAFLRSDELPGRAALGYLTIDGAGGRNVFHLPVRGSGDGGIYSTAGRHQRPLERVLRRPDRVGGLGRRDGAPAQRRAAESKRYGLGFWLHASTDAVILEGYDAGVSFRSTARPPLRRDADRDLEHVRRGVAGRPLSRGATRPLTASRCRGSAPRPADETSPRRQIEVQIPPHDRRVEDARHDHVEHCTVDVRRLAARSTEELDEILDERRMTDPDLHGDTPLPERSPFVCTHLGSE